MIINLIGRIHNDELQFNLFPLYFQNHQEIRAIYIGIEWSEQVGAIHGYLSSSLIDQSPMNENQELIRFQNVNISNYTFHAPLIRQYIKSSVTHFSRQSSSCTCRSNTKLEKFTFN